MVPLESVRYVHHDGGLRPRVVEGNEQVLKLVADQLGVLPDKRVRVLFYVEGPTDVAFLEHISKLTGHIDLTTDPRVAFVVTGGGNLKYWVNDHYLRHLQLPEVHFYDRDNDYGYAAQVAAVNARGDWGSLTSKREIENYLHAKAIHEATGFAIVVDDNGDIAMRFAEAQHKAAEQAKPWINVDDDDLKKKCSRAKKKLCGVCASKMTTEMLRARDPAGEIENLLVVLSQLASAQ
jgi:putative ATP-dependent endonuclease of the OLD family